MIQVKSCPICNNKAWVKFKTKGFKQYQDLKVEFVLYQCPFCFHQFFDPIPSDLKKIYEQEQYVLDGQKHPFFKRINEDIKTWPQYKTFSKRLNRVLTYIGNKKFRLLDVGCGSGLFVKICQQQGIKAVGIDISKTAIKLARKTGSNCYRLDFPSGIANSSFEVITMFDVLEHLDDPWLFLDKAHQVLKKNGFLFLTTPRGDSWSCKIFGRHWHLYTPPLHLNIFSTASLNLALKKRGFRVLKIENQGQWTNVSYAILKVLSLYGLEISWLKKTLSQTRMDKFNCYFNLFDVMMVYAQKE